MTELPAAVASEATSPDSRALFRQAQLLLLLEVLQSRRATTRTIDRLAYYDFFAANPFVAVSGTSRTDQSDRTTLRLQAFGENQVSYNATGQRFISRRRRIQHDMSRLVALGLASLSDRDGWHLTERGRELAAQFDAQYADSFRESASIVVRRLHPLGDRAMRASAEDWLGRSWLLVDFLDDVRSIDPNGDGASLDE